MGNQYFTGGPALSIGATVPSVLFVERSISPEHDTANAIIKIVNRKIILFTVFNFLIRFSPQALHYIAYYTRMK
jgi:hypothetical protein